MLIRNQRGETVRVLACTDGGVVLQIYVRADATEGQHNGCDANLYLDKDRAVDLLEALTEAVLTDVVARARGKAEPPEWYCEWNETFRLWNVYHFGDCVATCSSYSYAYNTMLRMKNKQDAPDPQATSALAEAQASFRDMADELILNDIVMLSTVAQAQALARTPMDGPGYDKNGKFRNPKCVEFHTCFFRDICTLEKCTPDRGDSVIT